MTSPADKTTDDVRGLAERLRCFAGTTPSQAASTLTSLLERAERAEARIKELEQERDNA